MTALVRKEVRLILPAFAAAMLLATVPVWLLWPMVSGPIPTHVPGILFAPFALGAMLLGLTPFGQELNFGTFSMLLAQPASRRRIWLIKTTVLAGALSLVLIVLALCIYLRADTIVETMKGTVWRNLLLRSADDPLIVRMIAETWHSALHDTLVIGGLAALAAFAGGLWTTLAFRQTSTAFWFTLLVPLSLGLFVPWLLGGLGAGWAEGMMIAALLIYSLAGFFWAKKFFLRVQDTQWTGGLISFPVWTRSRAASISETAVRKQKPIRALLRKEFQLQQINLFIAGLLLVSHLVSLVVRKLGADYFANHSYAKMAWDSWPFLWLVLPLLIGGAAVAEERRLGTLEGFLCLPTTRRRGFLVKLLMTMSLGMLLGGVVPSLVEGLGGLVGLGHRQVVWNSAYSWIEISPAVLSMLISAALSALSFYASTLTRNLLQGLGLAIVLAMAASAVIGAVAEIGESYSSGAILLWHGPLVNFVMGPVMVVALLWLAFANFKCARVGAKIWRMNILILLVSLLGSAGATSAIFHRAWELWMPEEPRHRFYSYQMNGPVPATMTATPFRIAIVTPDHQLWLRQRRMEFQKQSSDHNALQPVPAGPWRSGFVNGSNWCDVAVAGGRAFAIQSDGSLWELPWIRPGERDIGFDARRVGESSGWKEIAAGSFHFVGLKTDGTIWEWGEKFIRLSGRLEPISSPVQIGADSDWTAVSARSLTTIAVKPDGSIWRYGLIYSDDPQGTNRIAKVPERWLSGPAKQPMSITGDSRAVVAVAGNELWLGGVAEDDLESLRPGPGAWNEMVRLGTGTNWQEAKFVSWDWGLVLLGTDGSLWKSGGRSPFGFFYRSSRSTTIVSQYSDWIAICPFEEELLALASDGGLYFWRDLERDYSNGLLVPSRIKAHRIADLRK